MGLTDKHMAYGDDIEEGKRWSLYDKGYERGYKNGIAKSLEAWEKVKNDIYKIDWYGDDVFWDGVNLVSDIIDKHLAEVSE